MFHLSTDFTNPPEEAMWNQFRLYRLDQLQLTNLTQMPDAVNMFTHEEIRKFAQYRKFLMTVEGIYKSVLDIEFPAYAEYRDYTIMLVEIPYKVQSVSISSEEKFWANIALTDPSNELLKRYKSPRK